VPRSTSPGTWCSSPRSCWPLSGAAAAAPRGSRALTCLWQAALALRWFRDRTTCEALARDHGISRATAYRYLDEVIDVLAEQAPDLRQALDRARETGWSHVILDGKIIPADRCKEPAASVKGQVIDLWYSGKASARPTATAATSKPSSPRTDSRCGPPVPSPARCTTSLPVSADNLVHVMPPGDIR
jgi:hypothetical protein